MKPVPALAALAAVIAASVAAPSRATLGGTNGLLVYEATVGERVQLFTVRPDGSGTRQLTSFTDSDAINAAWSPDGRKIAFVRIWKQRGETQRVQTMNADGSGLRELAGKLRWAVAWLPGGKRLLAVRGLGYVTVRADGSGLRDAGIPGGLADSPCVFGDGKRVAFLRSKSLGDESRIAIFVGRLGGGPRQHRADHALAAPHGQDRLLARRVADPVQQRPPRLRPVVERLLAAN